MSIGKRIGWVHTLLSITAVWQVFTFRKVLFWLGKYEHEEERKKFYLQVKFTSTSACVHPWLLNRGCEQTCWLVSMLVAKKVTNAEKHLYFFRVVAKLWLSRVGSRHFKIWCGTPVTLKGTPRQLCLPLCLKTWMGTEEKRGQKSQKTVGRHSVSHTVLVMLTSLQTGLPVEVFLKICLGGGMPPYSAWDQLQELSWAGGSWPPSPSFSQGPDQGCLTALRSWEASGAFLVLNPCHRSAAFPGCTSSKNTHVLWLL